MTPRIPFWDRLKFFLERQFVKGPHYQLLAVAALIGLISLIGGLAVIDTGAPLDDTGSAVWWAFLRLTDPGYLGDDVGAWRRTVSTILTISGYVVFLGALVAILTQWLNTKMRQLEQGLTPVATRGHVVILGWTNRTMPVVRELMLSTGRLRRFLRSRGTRSLQLVILAREMSAAQAQALRDDPAIGRRARDIVLRSGNALNVEHLQRVSCGTASAIILPSEVFGESELISSDVQTVKTLMTIEGEALAAGRAPPYVVAELQDARKVSVARSAYHGPLEVIASDAALSRLIAQNLRQPGLALFYAEVLTHSVGYEFYVRQFPAAAGRRFGELAAGFPNALLCGLVREIDGEHQAQLCPEPGMPVRAEDTLVLLAVDYADTEWRGATGPLAPAITPKKAARRAQAPRRVLVLGWNDRHPAMLSELAAHDEDRFEVDFVSVLPAAQRDAAIQRYALGSKLAPSRQFETDFLVESELRALSPADYDCVLLASSDVLASEVEADARTVVGYLVLRQILRGTSRRPQVLVELSDASNEKIVGETRDEILVGPLLLSHMLAQVALRRELRAVFEALFGASGADVSFLPPERYGLSGRRSFADVAAAVAAAGDIALGLFRPGLGSGQRLQLNPDRSVALAFEPEDRIVVLGNA